MLEIYMIMARGHAYNVLAGLSPSIRVSQRQLNHLKSEMFQFRSEPEHRAESLYLMHIKRKLPIAPAAGDDEWFIVCYNDHNSYDFKVNGLYRARDLGLLAEGLYRWKEPETLAARSAFLLVLTKLMAA